MKAGIMTFLTLTGTLLIASLVLGSGYTHGTEGAKPGAAMMEQAETGSMPLRPDQIREIQTLLQGRGYQVGEINGIFTPETTEAVRQFQTDEGLAATGSPNQDTLRKLAPSIDHQEFFGLSTEHGEKAPMMEHKEMEPKKMY
jgi:peptidoglycan hydrolase-like protein with peptidoglycan-binding domain